MFQSQYTIIQSYSIFHPMLSDRVCNILITLHEISKCQHPYKTAENRSTTPQQEICHASFFLGLVHSCNDKSTYNLLTPAYDLTLL